jgi:hypothetical protein
MFFVLDPWSSAPVAYSSIRPKSQIFNIGHDYALWIRNFMVMKKIPENLDFETWTNGSRLKSVQSPKIQILGMMVFFRSKFMLMINNHFARFQLPRNLLKTKKMCFLFSWQHAISYLFVIKLSAKIT